jgi:hypothetical protein
VSHDAEEWTGEMDSGRPLGDEADTITHPAAFADGWIARELEDWDARTKDDIRRSLEALRRLLGAVAMRVVGDPAVADAAEMLWVVPVGVSTQCGETDVRPEDDEESFYAPVNDGNPHLLPYRVRLSRLPGEG